ncbi:alpha/beta hydrolase fold domain-containing protein [Streptomyces sp. RM72]|nr:alpha/beta hydrolase fold domain-containing protein [Streptomyces sp. RM72]
MWWCLIAAGDSAGGALATALTIRARDERRPLPDAVLLFSPCADATLTNPDIPVSEPRDPCSAAKERVGPCAAGPGTAPCSTPGSARSTTACAMVAKANAKAAGTQAEINLYPDAFHVFVGLPQLPESRAALAHARGVIKTVTET